MAIITRPVKLGGGTDFVAGNDVLAQEFNDDANIVYADYNGNITDANCSAIMGLQGTKLADAPNGVPTAKINDLAVTSVKILNDATVDANRAITTNHIKNLAITNAKLDALSVSGAKVAATTLSADKFKGLVIESVEFTSTVSLAMESIQLYRDVSGPNWIAKTVAKGSTGFLDTQTITPVTAIPTATKHLIGLYFDSLQLGGTVCIGNVIFISIDKT